MRVTAQLREAVKATPWRTSSLAQDLLGEHYAGRRDDGERELTDNRREALTRLVRLHRELFHPGLIRFHLASAHQRLAELSAGTA